MALAITGCGLVTAQGHEVRGVCAALRAGIRRPSPITGYAVLDDELNLSPVMGHVVPFLTDGLYFLGRWKRLAVGALSDLVRHARLTESANAGFWAATGMIGVTPVLDDRFGIVEPLSAEEVAAGFLEPVLRETALPIPTELLDVISVGPAGTIAAMEQAERWVEERRCNRVIVLAVDSLVDPMSLEWLGDAGRLKTGSTPGGVEPGEAGACFLVEGEEPALSRGARLDATIRSTAIDREPDNFFTDRPSQGTGLANAVRRCLAMAEFPLPFAGEVVTDLNGEQWRSTEFGNALVHLTPHYLHVGTRSSTPCESSGDAGSANAAVAVCAVVQSFLRNYSDTALKLILSSAEHGTVGAALLESRSRGFT